MIRKGKEREGKEGLRSVRCVFGSLCVLQGDNVSDIRLKAATASEPHYRMFDVFKIVQKLKIMKIRVRCC